MTLYICRCKSDVRYVSASNSGGVPGWFGLETMKSVRPILICGDGENACLLVKFLHGVLWEMEKAGEIRRGSLDHSSDYHSIQSTMTIRRWCARTAAKGDFVASLMLCLIGRVLVVAFCALGMGAAADVRLGAV